MLLSVKWMHRKPEASHNAADRDREGTYTTENKSEKRDWQCIDRAGYYLWHHVCRIGGNDCRGGIFPFWQGISVFSTIFRSGDPGCLNIQPVMAYIALRCPYKGKKRVLSKENRSKLITFCLTALHYCQRLLIIRYSGYHLK